MDGLIIYLKNDLKWLNGGCAIVKSANIVKDIFVGNVDAFLLQRLNRRMKNVQRAIGFTMDLKSKGANHNRLAPSASSYPSFSEVRYKFKKVNLNFKI